MTQDRRTKSLLDFKEGKVQILVATGKHSLDYRRVDFKTNKPPSQTSLLVDSIFPRSSS